MAELLFTTDAFRPVDRSVPGVPILLDGGMRLVEPACAWLMHVALVRGRTRSPQTWRAYGEALYDWWQTLEANGWAWDKVSYHEQVHQPSAVRKVVKGGAREFLSPSSDLNPVRVAVGRNRTGRAGEPGPPRPERLGRDAMALAVGFLGFPTPPTWACQNCSRSPIVHELLTLSRQTHHKTSGVVSVSAPDAYANMANYCTLLSVLFPVGAAENVAPALALYRRFRDELDEAGGWIGFAAEADDPPGSANLWLHSDEDADIEHVIAFALRAAEAFDLQGLWGFHWALSCSKPLLDGYGGGAQLLDLGGRRTLGWIDAGSWVQEEAARLREPTNAAAVAFNPVSTAHGWTGTTQTDLLLSFIGQEIAADPAVAGRFGAFLATVSGELDGPDEMLCRECGKPMFIEDNGVSHHEGGGLDGIGYALDLDHVAVAEREP